MCGRFVQISQLSDIAAEFDVDPGTLKTNPSYNIAPTQNILIIINDGGNKIMEARWGFIPSWAKDPSIGYRMINARGETVADKPAFRTAFKKQRCLIVADGFYEWKRKAREKVPMFIRLKSHKPFSFAGLYGFWTSPEKGKICSSTIITTEANEILLPFHDRMPVIIPKEWRKLWLDPGVQDSEKLRALMKPYPPEEMEIFEVSTKINSPSNNSPENLKPVKNSPS